MPHHTDFYGEQMTWVWRGLQVQNILLLPEYADELCTIAGSWRAFHNMVFAKKDMNVEVMKRFREMCGVEAEVEGNDNGDQFVPPTRQQMNDLLRRFVEWCSLYHGEPKVIKPVVKLEPAISFASSVEEEVL